MLDSVEAEELVSAVGLSVTVTATGRLTVYEVCDADYEAICRGISCCLVACRAGRLSLGSVTFSS